MIHIRKKKYEIIITFIMLFIVLSPINKKYVININNEINETMYQENLNFSKYKTSYKIVVIYYPPNYVQKAIELDNQNITDLKINKKNKINKYKSLIKSQIETAKNHGIFGFGIIYNCLKLNEEIYNLFANEHEFNIPFFIILNNYWNYTQHNISNDINEFSILFDNIISNFKSKNYIILFFYNVKIYKLY